ncbi:protein IQ-DOMAIN 3 [Alnus glutinosa]|uniref:protein IQ-DOMAIN 3 n=1 Tax=Alnus glutinosa TaxID=3517 RepID=UPI002D79B9F9|nr:protein IQ-DOMAIN 3 [Alnus glutinosa]XP_062155505.1 protein IQ-DOMAIN 3 [Alnus glutinosa]XP_062155506.1 protein IQ-DOMAIN 3 [Alnus glutinosa]
MGKKGGWFSAVKKALSAESKEKKDQKTRKPKKNWFGKIKKSAPVSSTEETALAIHVLPPASDIPAPPRPIEDVKSTEAENEQNKHAYSVAIASAVAAEAAAAAAQAAVEVVRLTTVPRYYGKSEEEIAAIKIQTAFRGYLARRALRALRGLVRLKSLIQGQSVKRQAASTLRCMQTLARVQSQIRSRRIRMSEENQALQQQLQQRCEKELEKLRTSMGEDWNDSTQSREQVEAKLQSRQEATIRRERALAYAFSHQQKWKNSSKSANPTFMDPNNPHWGWSWLERWMAARPWESRSARDPSDLASVKSAASRTISVGEITKAYSRRDINQDNKPSPSGQKSSRPPSRQSPSTPPSKATSSASVTGRRNRRGSRGSGWSGDDDSRSMLSVQSERWRRHSIEDSSVRDDESLATTPSVPSYMASTQSAKAKSRLPSPLGLEKNGTPEKGSAASVKKRLLFPASPAGPRRHSSPANINMDTSSTKDSDVHTEYKS